MYWRFSTVFPSGGVYDQIMKRRRTWAVGIGAFAVCFAACTAAPHVAEHTQSIINGTTDSGDPAVVLVISQVPGSQVGNLCTGEIIAPHVVLTAAHCVDPNVVGSGAKFVVFTGTTLSSTAPTSDFLGVAEVHFDTMFDASNPEGGHDVGVVILKNPTAITPVPYNRTPLPQSMVGQAARLVGYGITDGNDTMGTSAGTRRQAPTKLASFDAMLLNFEDMQHNICEGDSGGPAFMTIDGQERIVGVTSFGIQSCPLTQPGTDTRVDSYVDFIDRYVVQFDPPPVAAGGACSNDGECFPYRCQDTSVGRMCAQSCDPAASPSTCPDGTRCTSVDGQNLCTRSADGGGAHGGCDVGGRAPGAGLGLFLVGLALICLFRRRA